MSFRGVVKSMSEQSGYGFIECADTHEIYQRDVFFHKSDLPIYSLLKKGMEVIFEYGEDAKGHPRASAVEAASAPPPQRGAMTYPQQRGPLPAAAPYHPPRPGPAYTPSVAYPPAMPMVMPVAAPISNWPVGPGWSKRARPTEELAPDGKRMRSAENPGISSQVPTFTGIVKHKPDAEKGYGFISSDEIKREFNKDAFIHFSDCPWADSMDLQIGEEVLFNVDIGKDPRDIRVVRIVRLII